MLVFVTSAVCAQYYDDSPSLVLGLDAAFPLTAGMSDKNKPGIGGTAKYTLPIGERSDFVLAGSLMSFMGKKQPNKSANFKARNILALMAGYRYYLSPLYNYNTLYIEPKLGLTADGTKHLAGTYGVALGYLINNKIDLSARYQGFGGNTNSLSFIAIGIGYGFSLQ
ncbi:hypothetical protein GCM10011379_00070 [Filimonas zeae]|uniref:Outer membrane protein beta-barrel domain-containing protein n=2 Tax=Filimonas zeae TaxID=1737353 RepID=A0A917ILZ0_9BACT|nr:hypothetical protein GCM10011379_00070 [Filimonas zeae]